jgi:hypothetical protein
MSFRKYPEFNNYNKRKGLTVLEIIGILEIGIDTGCFAVVLFY